MIKRCTFAASRSSRYLLAGLCFALVSGCVGNVTSVQITRLHALPIPTKSQIFAINGNAQGGQGAPVTSASSALSKTSIGGDFQQQRASASTSYRLSGGFFYGR
ncbi:MAG: hypothetical protein ACXWPM_03660 [Bdellovibrionota bacterium]